MTDSKLITRGIQYDSLYGPLLPDMGWVPAPSYLLRRQRVLKHLKEMTPGSLLEIGCGGGFLLHELAKQGFYCQGLESSNAALQLANKVNGEVAPVHSSPQADWSEKFDYLIALEVLEHIEDDVDALCQWHAWLKPGGLLILSVPAHQRKWTQADVWAGHYRRYEKQQLLKQLASAGFASTHSENWGFPLSNMLLGWRAREQGKQLEQHGRSADDRQHNNDHSGIDRATALRLFPLLHSIPGRLVMRSAFALQHLSARRDWGTGYLVLARKPNSEDSNAT